QQPGDTVPDPVADALAQAPRRRRPLLLTVFAGTVLTVGALCAYFLLDNNPRDSRNADAQRPPPLVGDSPPLAKAPFDTTTARVHRNAWARHLGSNIEITNSIGMKLVLIPPGTFLMGSPDNDPDRGDNEGPQRAVSITRPFRLGVHSVTVGQFKVFVKER